MTEREALKLALEALEGFNQEFVCQATHHKRKDQHSNFEPCPNVAKYDEAIVSIKKALAQETPYEVGKKVAREGGGFYKLWGAVSHDSDLPEAQRGYEEALAKPEQKLITAVDIEKIVKFKERNT